MLGNSHFYHIRVKCAQGRYRQRQRQTLDFQQQQLTRPPHIKRGAWQSPARKSGFEGWGDGGVGKVLARKTWGPELHPLHPGEKLSVLEEAYPSAGEAEAGGWQNLAGQLAKTAWEFQVQ